MPSRTTFHRRQTRCLAFVIIALLGCAACSPTAIATAVTSPKPAVVLSGDSAGTVRFGEPQQEAANALAKLLGAAEGVVQNAKGNCTIDAALYWANFSVYFLGGRFVGYQTGNNLTDKPEPAFNGKTPQGLRIGDSLADARTLYPGRVTTRGENGGVYAITTATGTIRGYLSLEISNPPDKIKIVSISAGSVGCPAASPG
jgi:hypothetical protein